MDRDDIELLHDYVASDSDQAFEALVRRYVDLVYSAALRRVTSSDMAGEVTQTVFIILAKKARVLRPGVVLAGWLYRTTQLVASRAIRTEARRREREREAWQMEREESDLLWDQMAPLLEEAMATLGEADRNAVVLRYFQNKKLKEVGMALGSNEDAVQKRLSRAIEKLRGFFQTRGVIVPAGVLTTMLSAHAVQAAPAVVVSVSLAAGAGLSCTPSALSLAKGTLKFMTWTKTKTATVTTLLLLIGGVGTVALKKRNTEPGGQASSQGFLPAQTGQAQKMSCLDNLKQIGTALKGWAADHNQVFPTRLDSLENYLSAPNRLRCPADESKREASDWKKVSAGNVSYVMVSPGAKIVRPDLVAAKCPVHGTVLLAEGRVFLGDYIQQQGMRIMPDKTLQ